MKALVLVAVVTAGSGTWKGDVYAPRKDAFVGAEIRMRDARRFVLTAASGPFSPELTWQRR